MSVPPETASSTDAPPPRLMGAGFWMAISFGMVCVVAGAGATILGPRLFRTETLAAPLSVRPAALPLALPAPVQPMEPLPPQVPADAGEIDALNARIALLEARAKQASSAAATALAAAALVTASQGSRPFAQDLAALRATAPAAPEIEALNSLAFTGAPSRAALAQSFAEHAARAMGAARTPEEGARLDARLMYALSRVVSVRRVGDLPGDGVEARLARAERSLADGEVAGALEAVDGLPPRSRSAMAEWTEAARRRAAIDSQVAALRARALRDLTPTPTSPPSLQRDAAL